MYYLLYYVCINIIIIIIIFIVEAPKDTDKSKSHGVTIDTDTSETTTKNTDLAARRRHFVQQQSSVATRRLHAVCVRRAYKSYGPKSNPNVILDGLNMTVPKGSMYV